MANYNAPVIGDTPKASDVNQFHTLHPTVYVRDGVDKVDGAASQSGHVAFNTGSAVQWIAQPFTTAGGQTTIGRIELSLLLATGTVGADIVVSVQSNASGVPSGTTVATCIPVTVPLEFVGVSAAYLSIPMPISGLSAATKYHIVIKGSADVTNIVWLQYGTTPGGGFEYLTSEDGTTGDWDAGSGKTALFHVYDNSVVGNIRNTLEDSGLRWTGRDYTNGLPTTIREFTGALRSVRTLAYSNGNLISVT